VIVAFLLSAGDLMATLLLTFPLFGLYEVGIFLTLLFGKKKVDKDREEETSESD
jgi:sec-independent protein translocase protein TatC